MGGDRRAPGRGGRRGPRGGMGAAAGPGRDRRGLAGRRASVAAARRGRGGGGGGGGKGEKGRSGRAMGGAARPRGARVTSPDAPPEMERGATRRRLPMAHGGWRMAASRAGYGGRPVARRNHVSEPEPEPGQAAGPAPDARAPCRFPLAARRSRAPPPPPPEPVPGRSVRRSAEESGRRDWRTGNGRGLSGLRSPVSGLRSPVSGLRSPVSGLWSYVSVRYAFRSPPPRSRPGSAPRGRSGAAGRAGRRAAPSAENQRRRPPGAIGFGRSRAPARPLAPRLAPTYALRQARP